MTHRVPISARDLSLFELDRRHLPGWKPLLPRDRDPANNSRADPRDMGLAEQITFGVIQNHLHLQHLVEHYSGRRLKSIDPLVQKIISIGLYQLRFLDRIPVSAAVNEAVDQAKRFGRTKAAGFVNAVLRKALRDGPPPPPGRLTDPAAYAEFVLSHPRDVFSRLVELVGAADALRVCEHNNVEPPTIVRLFPGVTVAQLESPGVTLTPHEQAGMYVAAPAKRTTLADWARRGLAQVQDPTAAKVVAAVGVERGQTVLDRCAGLGTKTLQLRDGLGDAGRLVAVDPADDRITAFRSLVAERGVTLVEAYRAGMLAGVPALRNVLFDRILADVPCSNSGVLARRPEARYAQTPALLQSLDRLQRKILDDSSPHVKPGGLLVYSTCSIWPEENERQVDRFLATHRDFAKRAEHLTLPSLEADPIRYHDGGYFAVLERERA